MQVLLPLICLTCHEPSWFLGWVRRGAGRGVLNRELIGDPTYWRGGLMDVLRYYITLRCLFVIAILRIICWAMIFSTRPFLIASNCRALLNSEKKSTILNCVIMIIFFFLFSLPFKLYLPFVIFA